MDISSRTFSRRRWTVFCPRVFCPSSRRLWKSKAHTYSQYNAWPRSDVGSNDFITSLTSFGFEVDSWVGYENKAKDVTGVEMGSNDVLLLSSPSSAKAWMKNSLPIPKNILCMGKTSREEIASMDYFAGSTVEVLKGPTAKFVSKWWKNYEVKLWIWGPESTAGRPPEGI